MKAEIEIFKGNFFFSIPYTCDTAVPKTRCAECGVRGAERKGFEIELKE